jgi:hypothetical protein
MTIGYGDITYLYSGGAANLIPDLSLGGSPSVHQILNNQLFDTVTSEQSINGMTDYRCIYISNDSSTENLYSTSIYISTTNIESNVYAYLGYQVQNDRQYINITNFNTCTGGSITFAYEDTSVHNFTFNYNSSVATFASNFQTAIRAITYLEDVTVSATYDSGTDILTFEINFVGDASSRYHETISLNVNNLTYTGGVPLISFIKSVNGGPINREAELIDFETTPPANVVFSNSSYSLGTFRALDVIPVWIKRIVPKNSIPIEIDGFTVRMRGQAISP